MDRASTLFLVLSSLEAPALPALLQAGQGTKLLLTTAMPAYILILVNVTHITCCGTYSFCNAILSQVLVSPSGGGDTGSPDSCSLVSCT
jgi:hypothetical protein